MCNGHRHGKAKRDVKFIEGDKDRQLKILWRETKIGNVLPWEGIANEADRLMDMSKASQNAPNDDHDEWEHANNQEVDQDETDSHNEVIFGRGRFRLSRLDQQSPFCFGIQAHNRSKKRLPKTGGISSKCPTQQFHQKPRKGGKRSRR